MQKLSAFFALPFAILLSTGCLGQQSSNTQPVDPAKMSADAAAAQQQQQLERYRKLANDYGQLSRYAAADAALPAATAADKRVIFFGDSITDGWHLDQSFPGKGYLNRGISGQTTPQMLVRFREDVIDLHPAVVLVLAGTNDLAGNTGPETTQQIEDNFATMAELARLHGFQLVFSSVTPVSSYGPAGQGMLAGRPPAKILELDSWLKHYCADHNLVYLDYFPAMADGQGMMQKAISNDGLHPNAAGYTIMAPLAQAAIEKAFALPTSKP
jgi:lysophospholipase L1-like esterase